LSLFRADGAGEGADGAWSRVEKAGSRGWTGGGRGSDLDRAERWVAARLGGGRGASRAAVGLD